MMLMARRSPPDIIFSRRHYARCFAFSLIRRHFCRAASMPRLPIRFAAMSPPPLFAVIRLLFFRYMLSLFSIAMMPPI